MSFENLDLHPNILKAIEESGYSTPTPIQNKVIPEILRGFDLRASAPTGTGKTAAFILPSLNLLANNTPKRGRGPRLLVLVPTRELAMQVAAQANKYSKYLKRMKTVCIFGGTPYPIQNKQLSQPYEILIATPGRLIDHLQRGRIEFSRLEMLVLDEADRMLDMGFIQPVNQIAEATPEDRQTLLFSATLKGTILELSERLMNNPMEIKVEREKAELTNIDQRLHYVDNKQHKHDLLNHFLEDGSLEQAIVFTSTKREADFLASKLSKCDLNTAALHGDMNQRQRNRTIRLLRSGKVRVLIATDVAARGIDVSTISHVINFDLPQSAEDYVHRIGRTGRAGAKGIAVSFAEGRDLGMVREIERFTGSKMPRQVISGLEPKTKEASRPPRNSKPKGARNHYKRKFRSRPRQRA